MHKTKIMHKTKFLNTFSSVIDLLGPHYRTDLEGRGMKAARKGEGSVDTIISTVPVSIMTPLTGALYGTRGNIDRIDTQDLSWETIKDAINGNCMFDQAYKPKAKPPKYTSWTSKEQNSPSNLIDWLIKTGYLKVTEYTHNRSDLPNIIQLALYDPKSKTYSSFIWNKEMQADMSGYITILYPTVSYNPDTSVIEVMHPLTHLSLWLSRHFACSLNITSSKYIHAIFNNGGSIALEAAMREYVQQYGEILHSEYTNHEHKPYKVGLYFATRSITIDHCSIPNYTNNWSEENMIMLTKHANKLVNGLHLPSTGNKRSVRRHFIASPETGLPDFVKVKEGVYPCQAHRPGRNRSLLVRSLGASKLRVAVVASDTIQCYLTPSGVEKTELKVEAFFPSIAFQETDGYELTKVHSWNGTPSWLWISKNSKQDSKKVGKLLCLHGSRFEPQETIQWKTEAGLNIDLLYSFEELQEKDLSQAFLSEATLETIVSETGQQIETYVLEWIFFRSGTASENIQPRYVSTWSVQGFVGLMLAASLRKHEVDYTHMDNQLFNDSKNLFESAEKLMYQSMSDKECYVERIDNSLIYTA